MSGVPSVLNAIFKLSKPMQEKAFKALPGISFESKNDQLVINAPHLNNNKIVTNDIIELKSNQSFIWKARKDFVINCGGIKYFPELIEKKIIGLEDRSFIVCGIPLMSI